MIIQTAWREMVAELMNDNPDWREMEELMIKYPEHTAHSPMYFVGNTLFGFTC
jgi:hypothetical protein